MEETRTRTDGSARLLLLGDARQIHLIRWATYFNDAGYGVLTASLERNDRFKGAIAALSAPSFLPDFLRYPLCAGSVRTIIDEFKPDIINAHFLPNYGMIASMINRAPWVLSAWGSDVMLVPDKSPFHRWRTRYVLGRASFITSDAEVMSARLVEFGCDPARILTVPFGVDLGLFHPERASAPAGGPRLLSNRKLEPVYNIATIIDAFARVRHALPEASLTVVGSGSAKKSLLQSAQASPARGAIEFRGEVAHDEVPALLRGHDIYLSMSRSDTTSVSLLEAMACGTFPIVGDIPANREWIEDGENGRLVPVDDPQALAAAVERAWADRSAIEKARSRNLAIIKERANWSDNMALVDELFKKAIGEIR
ncbi:MAG: glycosyltransferase [Chitinivibrionia bacterium]|nr:glycosyltransferase [Chitinivibrionia bacterium]